MLAGGSGTRLASLTARAGGTDDTPVPKQYCSLQGGRSLLGDALARAERVAPPERIVTVVAAEHETYWRTERGLGQRSRPIVQPQNRGTAPGILLPLLSIARRDPNAQVTLLPSDHFVEDEPALARALCESHEQVERDPDRVLLVGIAPEGPEPDYGWILPSPQAGATRLVERFVEKPDRDTAAALMRMGAVWNGFLLVGSVRAMLRLYERRLPRLLEAFRAAGNGSDPAHVARLYESIPPADFSRGVLAGSEPHLALRIAPPCGWTDLGTPQRVARCAQSLASPAAFCAGSLGAAALAAV